MSEYELEQKFEYICHTLIQIWAEGGVNYKRSGICNLEFQTPFCGVWAKFLLSAEGCLH